MPKQPYRFQKICLKKVENLLAFKTCERNKAYELGKMHHCYNPHSVVYQDVIYCYLNDILNMACPKNEPLVLLFKHSVYMDNMDHTVVGHH